MRLGKKTNSVLQAAALKSEKQPSRGQWKRYKFKSSSQFTEQSRIPSGNLGLNADKTNKIKVIKIKAFFLVGPLLLFLPIIFLTKDSKTYYFSLFKDRKLPKALIEYNSLHGKWEPKTGRYFKIPNWIHTERTEKKWTWKSETNRIDYMCHSTVFH